MTLNEWLRKNNACTPGFKWAISTCKTLEDVWNTAKPEWLIWVATREGVLSDRELWLFACHCAEQALPNWYKFAPDDHRPRIAIETRRKWLDGLATDEELAAAESAARSAASAAWSAAESAAASAASAARSAAESASRSAARSAAESAAESEAESAAAAARSAASAAWSAAESAAASAWSAAWSAAESAAASARSAQAEWLRANTKPNFAGVEE